MSEERTAETNGSKSFEERVFARFDAIDGRFDSLEGRILKLEVKQYDTRPIWEQALSAIAQINTDIYNGFAQVHKEMDSGFAELRTEIAATKSEMDSGFTELRTQIAACATKSEMEAGFAELRNEIDFGLRGVERKIDALNHNIMELHADHRYVDSRLEKVEAQLKPS